MKRLLLTLTAIAGLTFAANAQEFGFGQGNIILEGNIGFESESDKNAPETKFSSFTLSPKAGYFVTDKIAVGIGLDFTSATDKVESAGYEEKTNSFGVEVFGRYYFLELGSRFKTYAEAGVGFGSAKQEETPATGVPTVTNYDRSAFGIGAGIGANYFLTEKIALNLQLTDIISFTSTKPDGGEATSNFNLNAGSVANPFAAVAFGLTFKF